MLLPGAGLGQGLALKAHGMHEVRMVPACSCLIVPQGLGSRAMPESLPQQQPSVHTQPRLHHAAGLTLQPAPGLHGTATWQVGCSAICWRL